MHRQQLWLGTLGTLMERKGAQEGEERQGGSVLSVGWQTQPLWRGDIWSWYHWRAVGKDDSAKSGWRMWLFSHTGIWLHLQRTTFIPTPGVCACHFLSMEPLLSCVRLPLPNSLGLSLKVPFLETPNQKVISMALRHVYLFTVVLLPCGTHSINIWVTK